MPTQPAPTPTGAEPKGVGPQKDDDRPARWIDTAGHPIEPADGGVIAWIHSGGPIANCTVVAFLRNPPEDVRSLPGLGSGFYKRRRYQLAIEVAFTEGGRQ